MHLLSTNDCTTFLSKAAYIRLVSLLYIVIKLTLLQNWLGTTPHEAEVTSLNLLFPFSLGFKTYKERHIVINKLSFIWLMTIVNGPWVIHTRNSQVLFFV